MPQAIGVDLGTTFSCVGVLLNSNVDIIPNEMSKRTTPSVVAFNEHNQDPDVGEGAYEQTDPAAIVFEAKRLIGRKFSDLEVQQDVATWPFKVEANEKDDPIVCVNAGGKPKKFKPEEISAMVLAKLKTSADAFVGEEVKKAVITVPAYFNDGQRQATRRAAEIAGLEVLRIINEPTAAAIGYWFQRQGGNRNLLVYDLGGGTFDVSVLQVQDSDITVKATSGNSHLGGSDFDNHILNFCVEEFAKAHNVNITTDKRAMSRLRQRCETAKRTLSGKVEAMIVIDSLINGIDMKQRLSRAKFEDMCRPQLDNTIHLVRAALGDAGLRPTDIDEVILVGGCSKIPKVNLMLSQIFGSDKIRKNINCDEAVAFGAAVLAAKLAENPSVQIGEKSVKAPIPTPRLPKIGTLNEKDTALLRNLQLNDITPLSLGIEIAGGAMVTIIPKNTRIPVTKEKVFRAASDTTTSIRLSLYQGENDVAKLNTHLGNLFMQLKPGQGNSRIVVVIDVDVNGIIKIRAQSEATGAEVSLVVNDRRGH